MNKSIIYVLICLITAINVFAAADQNKPFKVGINMFGVANYFIEVARDTAVEEVKKLGGIALCSVSQTVSERINSLENFITQGVDAIIVGEGDIKMVEPVLQQAKQKGIIIAAMNSGTGDFVDVIIEPNNWVGGVMAACELMDRINGQGKIVEIYNDLGQMIRMRRAMLHTVLTEYPHVEIVAGFTYAWPDFYPDVMAKMEAVLQAHPDINGVFATFFGVGVAAAQVIREQGLQNQVVIVSIDIDPTTYEEMKKPDSPIKATYVTDPQLMAKTAVKVVFDIFSGKEILNKHIYIPGFLITKENLENVNSYEELFRQTL